MRIYRIVLGIIILLFIIIGVFGFVYGLTQIYFSKSNFSLYLMIMCAIGIYIALHFVILCKIGFYKNPELETKRKFLLNYFPFLILIILLCITVIKYRIDIKSSMIKAKDRSISNNDNSYFERENIISDTTLNIAERFKKLRLGGYGKNSSIVDFSYETISEDPEISNSKSLNDYYNKFKLLPKNFEQHERIKRIRDTIFLKLGNGKIKKEIFNDKSKNYIGYIEDQNLFVIEDQNQSSNYRYYSINALDGYAFIGVPIFGNKDSEIYSDLHFDQKNEKYGLNIRFWHRDEKNSYEMILDEEIPMNYYFDKSSSFPCKISNIYWENNTFNFTITINIDGREERLKVSADVLIQG